MAIKPRIVKIEDHEGNGHCQQCGRENLRWIATLTDGTRVGTECAKAIIGFKPAPKTYTWVTGFTPVAEHTEVDTVWVLWRSENGRTALTLNGALWQMGGCDKEWTKRGWAA